MNKKKLTALVLVLVLALSLAFALTACNDPKGGPIDKLPNLSILLERDDSMINTYTMIAVDSDGSGFAGTNVNRNEAGADAFIKWMSLASTRTLISDYGVADYGEHLFYLLDNATVYSGEVAHATEATKEILISTTTSVNDSGLLGYLVPVFEKDYGYNVQIVSAGTGAAINVAKAGNCDLILVHAESSEEAFVAGHYCRIVDGFTSERVSFMYNYFVLVGATSDPAGVKTAADVPAAFAKIAQNGSKFISRGDNSGTHVKERALWTLSGVTLTDITLTTKDKDGNDIVVKAPAGNDGKLASWYVSAGQGMGSCLTMANEMSGYCLTDKATFLTYKNWIEK